MTGSHASDGAAVINPDFPFFSIITICKNDRENIVPTIFSVLGQSFGDFEIIIKDGGSTDGTLETVPTDSRIRIICEPDGGIYDAMNAGIDRIRGRYVQFLNCGDTLADMDVLMKVHKFCESSEFPRAVIYGDVIENGEIYYQYRSITDQSLIPSALNHQSAFFHTGLFSEFGKYDTSYRVLADNDLFFRLYKGGVPFIHTGIVIDRYLGNGFSESPEGRRLYKTEWKQTRNKYFSRGQMIKYRIKRAISFPVLRRMIRDGKSPALIKKLYKSAVILVKRRNSSRK